MVLKKKEKILVAMSGGVDSSVVAALLVKAGYDVTGAYMVNYEGQMPSGELCWHADYQDALRVAAHLGIPLIRLDFVAEYKKFVLNYLYKEYSAGRTPNPDIMCNKFVKFGFWIKAAEMLGFDKMATGHYANLIKRGGKFKLLEAKDKNKDQTYFLHQLNQKQLSKVIFPIGEYTKPEVRQLAKKFNLPTAEKEESMGICFIGEVSMRDFLKGKVKAKSGKIINTTGEAVGEHNGLPFYTIGERGLNLDKSKGQPYFVVGKNLKKNQLIVGFEDDPALFKKSTLVKNVNWISGQTPKFPLKCQVRMRHRQPLVDCILKVKGSDVLINFNKPERAVTPGQFAVFVKNGECLGGGVVK